MDLLQLHYTLIVQKQQLFLYYQCIMSVVSVLSVLSVVSVL